MRVSVVCTDSLLRLFPNTRHGEKIEISYIRINVEFLYSPYHIEDVIHGWKIEERPFCRLAVEILQHEAPLLRVLVLSH